MPFYACLMRGENFVLSLEGEPKEPYGFYTTRCVEAGSPDQAELKALDVLRAEEF